MGNHHEIQGLQRMLGGIQFSIPDGAGMRPDPVGKNPDMRCSKSNEASRTPDFSNLHITSTSFPSSSSLSLSHSQLYHHRKNTKLSHPSLSLYAMIMS